MIVFKLKIQEESNLTHINWLIYFIAQSNSVRLFAVEIERSNEAGQYN